MPRKKRNQRREPVPVQKGIYSPENEKECEWGGYVNVRIDDETKEAYHRWIEEKPTEFWVLLEEAVNEGLKYSLSYDYANDCYVAAFTGCGDPDFDIRLCLTGRSDRFEDATGLLVYKHHVICQGNWGGFRPAATGLSSWG